MDITHIPTARGFVYFAVVLDWFSRRVLAWRVSITMEAAFCVETLEEAIVKHGKPEIFNTDQGSQFAGAVFTGLLIKNGIAISMDAKVRGETTSSSSVCDAASNTRRCISGPTIACPRPAHRLAASLTSTTGADLTRVLTGARPIKLISPHCPSAWQPNQSRRSTYRRVKTVQTTGTISVHIARR
jgi:putative transposase